MHLHVTLNRIVMLHNFVTPNILSHVPKIIRNTPKYTATAKIEYFSNRFISNGPFNNWFVKSYLLFFVHWIVSSRASTVSSEAKAREPFRGYCQVWDEWITERGIKTAEISLMSEFLK